MEKPVPGRSEELVTSTVLLAVGSAIPILWGFAHIIPTKAVVAGFGQLSADNRRILTMEWVAEGLALVFLGALPGLMLLLGPTQPGAVLAIRAAAVMLLVMAAWTALTGARTSVVPIKLCPVVKTLAALCLLAGSALS